MIDFITPLLFGFGGSIHCAGMCGPIALALPVYRRKLGGKIAGALIYTTGRSLTYAVLGLLFGLFGQGFVLAGMHRWLSIALGVVMILSVLFPLLFKRFKSIESKINSIASKQHKRFSNYFSVFTYKSLLIIGLLNGLLPCGLVYYALAGAMQTGNYLTGGLFMFLFGLGTAPMLMGISILGNTISLKIRKIFNKVVPVFIILIGVLFILRGLNLGIPYISPAEQFLEINENPDKSNEEPNCH